MSKSKNGLLSISGIMILTLFGQLISFVREAVFAAYYGVSVSADAYVIAAQVPVTLFAVVGVSLTTTVLPIYTKKIKAEGNKEANSFINNMISIFTIISILFVVIGVIFAPEIVNIFAPSFSQSAKLLTIKLTRIIFPIVIFSSLFNIYKAIHNAYESFFIPVIAVYIQSIVISVAIILFGKKFGIYPAAIATVVAGALEMCFLAYTIRKKYVYKPYLNIFDSEIENVLKLIGPVILGVGIAEVNRVIDRMLASGAGEGAVASINYASKLINVFSGLLVSGLSVVCFQKFTELYAENKIDLLLSQFLKYIKLASFFTIPISCGLLVMSNEAVTIVFGRGEFNESAVHSTSCVFLFYSLGLTFIVLRELGTKVFYAMHDTKTPMFNSAIGVGINIVLNIILVKKMGAAGLALATSISSFIICMLLFKALKKKQQKIQYKRVVVEIFKIILASAAMCICIVLSEKCLIRLNIYLRSILLVLWGCVVYFAVTFGLKSEVLMPGIDKVKKVIIKKRN